MRIAIVGAGMAGLACMEALVAAGHAVSLFDKGRAPGGRMSTRRVTTVAGDAAFDHGAQYFTARDPAFRARVARWQDQAVAAPWPAAGPDAWVGTPGMNAPVKQMASTADIQWSTQVETLVRDGAGWQLGGSAHDAVLVAIPAEQAGPLLAGWDPAMADRATATPAAPCWTVMAAFAARLPIGPDIVRDAGIIGWAARNSAKPDRSGPESWVVQANPDWSRQHLEQRPEDVLPPLLEALAGLTGTALPPPLTATAHRWRFARSGSAGDGMLWNGALQLGACGDWLIGPRVEAAWLSGTMLARAVMA